MKIFIIPVSGVPLRPKPRFGWHGQKSREEYRARRSGIFTGHDSKGSWAVERLSPSGGLFVCRKTINSIVGKLNANRQKGSTMSKKEDPAVEYEVTDSKGKKHKVKTNFMGQRYRDAWSPGRFFVAIMIFFPASSYVEEKISNRLLVFLCWILLIIIIRMFVLNVLLDDEELKTIKAVEPKRKTSS